MQIKVLAFAFNWIFKQQLNLLLILYGKVTSDKKIISVTHQGYKDGNRDYCSHFSVTFETIGKSLIIFVSLILGKMGVDGPTEPRRDSDIKYDFYLKTILKGLGGI